MIGNISEKKRGRPSKENTKRAGYHIRLSDEEFQMVKAMCNQTGKTKSEIIRNSIKICYNLKLY